MNNLNKIKKSCLRNIIDLHYRATSGHIGTSLSCVDILIYLVFKRMEVQDEFILSKGHGAAALYSVLAEAGTIDKKLLDTYYKDGTLLAAHPPCGNKVPGIRFGTGSLGHGLSLSTGLALATKFTKEKKNIYCVLSDGDCNEGSTWEAAFFAAHHNLSNLYVIVDRNSLQGFGRSEEVLDLEPFAEKWKSANFDTYLIENGNDFESIAKAFDAMDKVKSERPKCFIAKTIKGSGVSYMEDKMEWHYLPMTDEQYEIALKEIEAMV